MDKLSLERTSLLEISAESKGRAEQFVQLMKILDISPALILDQTDSRDTGQGWILQLPRSDHYSKDGATIINGSLLDTSGNVRYFDRLPLHVDDSQYAVYSTGSHPSCESDIYPGPFSTDDGLELLVESAQLYLSDPEWFLRSPGPVRPTLEQVIDITT